MNLVLFEPGARAADGTVSLGARHAGHVRRVLRAAPGDEVRVGEVGGRIGSGRILALDEDRVRLAVTLDADPPPPLGIDLLLALPRPKTLRRLLRAVASLGVKRIVIVNAARVEKSYFDSPLLAPRAIRAELLDGLEQARDTVLPEVRVEPLFRPFVEDRLDALWPGSPRLVAHPAAADSLAAATRGLAGGPPRVLAIGPDGGWVPFELELLGGLGFRPFSLGPRPLRVDVACVVALAQLAVAPGSPPGPGSSRLLLPSRGLDAEVGSRITARAEAPPAPAPGPGAETPPPG